MNLTRRSWVSGITCCGVACGIHSSASSQGIANVCAYGGTVPQAAAVRVDLGYGNASVGLIRGVLGLQFPISVYQTLDPRTNAAAMMAPGGPTIIFNSNFLAFLWDRAGGGLRGDLATVSVLAHEVGHIAGLDPVWVRRTPWENELGADFVSGYAIRRLGGTLDQAAAAQIISAGIFGPAGSATHPDVARRINAVSEGWRAAPVAATGSMPGFRP
jgi:hypothetical protein